MLSMRKFRIASQIIFFACFALSFLILNTHPRAYHWDSQWFLRLNPLVALLVMIASRSVVPLLLGIGGTVLIATMIFGRFFCGMVCPLGAMIDFSDRFVTLQMRSPTRRPPLYFHRLKYILLIAMITLALFGAIAPLFFDPISLLTRIFAIVLYPILLIIGTDSVAILKPAAAFFGSDSFSFINIKSPLFYGTIDAIILLIVIMAGGFWDKRFWCQYVCPTGAFLGAVSKFVLFRRTTVAQTCNNCKLCAHHCPTRAISEKDITITSSSECILCGICVETKKNITCNRFAFSGLSTTKTSGPDIKRRHALGGVLAGLLMLPAFRTNAFAKHDNTGRLVRPPGALPEKDFLHRCIGCGQCIKVCPSNALQPCETSDGINRYFTPKLVPRIGGCQEKCWLCSHVCPTGALRPLTYDEKSFAKIGTAVIDRHRCLAWSQNKECLVCDETCPYNAIIAKVVDTTKGPYKVPVVYEDLCVGCGLCEHECPIFDEAAIIVYKFGENRRSNGPYVTEWQKQSLIAQRNVSDSSELGKGFNLTDANKGPGLRDSASVPSGSNAPVGFLPDEPQIPKKKPESGLPPGFLP